ncbi:MAG: protease family protein [Acidobacteriota bacterium]|jgi:membrane protease YdiL (CAAX protease family)|nr:protease family protein [Acidobacteriota bacterium]
MNELAPPAERTPVAFPLTRRAVIIFSLAATAIFALLAWTITVYFRKQSFYALFTTGQTFTAQIILGLLLGIIIAASVVLILLKASFLARLRDFIREILKQIRPTGFDMILVALLAGFGEELFFRALLQPMLGLWLTSLLFALAHTGVSLNPAKLAFAAFVFVMGLLLGTLFEQSGLIAVSVMHASYDLIFLFAVKRFLHTANH